MQRIFGEFVGGRVATGLLILRVLMGAALMLHGWGKILNPFHWNDSAKQPAPAILQALVALGEFGGGLGLVVGCLTPLAALGVIITMLGIWFKVHRGDPWVNPGGKSFETASVFFITALTLLFTGPGRYSLDAILFGKKRR